MAILSIQSHVVYGYAGNTAAVFPMQRLGREVWAVNTVEFSNHTGYGSWKGMVLGSKLTEDLVTGLEERGVLNRCEAVLSGYLGDSETGKSVINSVKKVKKYSPNALYICDPVMGDAGRGFYVKPGIPDMFKNELVPLADIICPNQFELEALTGINVKNRKDALKAINILHKMGSSIVLVTSYKEKADELCMIASGKTGIFIVTTPLLSLGDGVAGTGDMTTALFLSHYLNTGCIKETLELCVSSVFSVLEESLKLSCGKKDNLIELKIIDTQQSLITPLYTFKAEQISET